MVKLEKELEMEKSRTKSLGTLRDKQHEEIMALRSELSSLDIRYHGVKDEKEKLVQDLKAEIQM